MAWETVCFATVLPYLYSIIYLSIISLIYHKTKKW